MASGSFIKYVKSGREYIKVWWKSTPDPANNRSKVRVWAKMYRPYYLYVDFDKKTTLTIAGKTYESHHYGWRGQGWTKTFVDKTVYVNHNSDGKKTIHIKLKTEIEASLGGTWYNSVTTDSVACKLDNLTRKSSIRVTGLSTPTSETIGNKIIVVLDRSSSKVRHAITFKVGAHTWSILSKSDDNGSTSSYTYTIPASVLSYMSSKSATATVTCTTYNGSTSLGSTSKKFTVNIRDTDKPTLASNDVTLTLVPISPNTITNTCIAGKTKLRITVTPTKAAGAAGAISNYKITMDGSTKSYTDNIVTYTITKPGTHTVKVSVVDKRGMTSSTVTKTLTALKYQLPKLSLRVNRCNADGTANKNGTSIKAAITGSISNCGSDSAGAKYNKATVKLYYKNALESTYTQLGTWSSLTTISLNEKYDNFSVDNSFEFKAVVTDLFGTTTVFADVGTEELLLDFSKNAAAFGKVVEKENALEVAWDAYFEGIIHGTVANASDKRLKTIVYDDIEPLLRIWDNLSAVLFKYSQQSDNKVQIGLIAQEVIELFENEGLDWRKYGVVYEDPETGYYSINYEFINQLSMVKAKIMQLQLLRLESRIDALEAGDQK